MIEDMFIARAENRYRLATLRFKTTAACVGPLLRFDVGFGTVNGTLNVLCLSAGTGISPQLHMQSSPKP